jgi:hypothetical protein
MKAINFLLVLVLALGFLAFGAQAPVSAAGTVTNPSGVDNGECNDGILEIATALAYINGVPLQSCTSFLATTDKYPKAPGTAHLQSKPVIVYFNQDVNPQVTVCFPIGPGGLGQVFKVVDSDPDYWIAIPTYDNGNKMACGNTQGGGVFGYFK